MRGVSTYFGELDTAFTNITVRDFTNYFIIIENNVAKVSMRGFDFSVINYVFTNILLRGFTIDFGVINYAFANILARCFTIDFDFMDNVFANISARGFDFGFGVIGYIFVNILARGFAISSTSPSPSIWS